MKAFILLMVTVALLGCGDGIRVDGDYVDTYGLFTESQKVDDVEYRIIMGNVIWSAILCQSIVFPVYFVGFSLWEPVGPKIKVIK